jgi:signal transduction histidine kinase
LLCLSIALSCRSRQQSPLVLVATTPDYDKGFAFLNRQNDSAYFYFNKVVNSSKDSLQIAMAYNNMAICQSDAGDYYGSQESLLRSLHYLHEGKEKDQWCLVADYNELGTDNLNLKYYDAAIDYYDRVINLVKDEGSKAIATNNKALTYEKKGQNAQAIALYESILTRSKRKKRQYARVLTNLAMARWRQDSGYRAAPDLLLALQIRKGENDEWGLNSSYSHLADYYTSSRPDSALGYALEMYAVTKRIGSPDDEVEALRKLILLGPSKDVKFYFTRYQHLQDSLETVRNSAKNQFALIRYEAEKNKADNLRLQRENAERQAVVVRQQAIELGGALAFVILTGWGLLWYRRRKERMRVEKESAIRVERLQLSQKVHDRVANELYQLMKEMQNGDGIGKEELLDRIDMLYEQSRDISYEPTGDSGDDSHTTVAGLLTPFGNPGTKVLMVGNDETLWEELKPEVKYELMEVLRELMINMSKHSNAQNVLVKFDWERHGLNIQYTDDGVGFPAGYRPGNGLTSTGNRIAALGGRIIFDRNTPTGVSIRIYVPND